MSDTLVLDRIQTSLTRLRLPRMGEILESVMQASQEGGKSYLTFLDDLLEEEVCCREQRRIETSLKISGLPFIKSIDEFDFAFQPKLDRQKVMSLFDLTFIPTERQCGLSGSSRRRQDPSGRIARTKSLPSRHEHLFYHHGRPDRKAEKRP
jgi:DNA replication protein DnaC